MTCYVDRALVHRLICHQFPHWSDLPIRPIIPGGWDNKTFRLGDDLLIRMPTAAQYASQVEKEHMWLPKLAPFLPLRIPYPVAMGMPGEGYAWKWSIYRWIEGVPATSASIQESAQDLAHFLAALHQIDTTNGPLPGPHSFYRGGSLSTYDEETRKAISILSDKIDAKRALDMWEQALATEWKEDPVWVHGDISAGNLLLQEDKLYAVIDFGQLTIGDPACDLAIAWINFDEKSRDAFRKALTLDAETWMRGQAWALWKTLIILAGITQSNTLTASACMHILDTLLQS